MRGPLISNILGQVVARLHDEKRLELVVGASVEALAEELGARIDQAPPFTQFSRWLSTSLLDSALVEELYATDEELFEMLSWVEP